MSTSLQFEILMLIFFLSSLFYTLKEIREKDPTKININEAMAFYHILIAAAMFVFATISLIKGD